MPRKIFCVGVGPGDVELITVKAIKILKEAQIIFSPTSQPDRPSLALSVIKPILEERQIQPETKSLIFPMIKKRDVLEKTWIANADAIAHATKNLTPVAYVTMGDPALYSTFAYLYRELRLRYPEIDVEVVPAVTAMTACASKAKLSLADGGDSLAIVPAVYDLETYRKIIEGADNLVIIKNGHHFKEVFKLLRECGFEDDSLIGFGNECTMPWGTMQTLTMKEASTLEMPEKYFSVLIAKRKGPSAVVSIVERQ
ncbi:MAG: precorrin-2 C(20)-methyltransferase [Candidatus Bathyarchaeia archaeon]